mmetsp:Transcript_4351/g.7059  ORF Transcript_4351/g.7059 Transcript_4351/m.7059 type:complete len:86 (-) Transcript_4351:493-750(-)
MPSLQLGCLPCKFLLHPTTHTFPLDRDYYSIDTSLIHTTTHPFLLDRDYYYSSFDLLCISAARSNSLSLLRSDVKVPRMTAQRLS